MNSFPQLTFLKYFYEPLQQRISGLTLFVSGLLKILETQYKPRDIFLFFGLVRTIFKIWLLNCLTFLFQNFKFVVFRKKCLIIPCHFLKKVWEKNIILHLLLRCDSNYQGVYALARHSYGCELKCKTGKKWSPWVYLNAWINIYEQFFHV